MRGNGTMASHDTFLLRIDPAVLEGVRRWAVQDLRSVNRQIEFLLREALLQDGRLNPDRREVVGSEHNRLNSRPIDTAHDGDKDAGGIEGR
jgi:hypothetical protein